MFERELKARLSVIESQRAEAASQLASPQIAVADHDYWQGQVDNTVASAFPEYMRAPAGD